MRINTNVAALNSYNQLSNTNNKLSKSLERLSSGKRINGAADDAAGLAISEKMNSQTRGLAQAQRNAQDAISMNQTAEGALKESHSILQRMRELAVQSANDTNTDADRAEIQEEVNQLSKELTRISETTEFNTQKLLDGTLENTFQIGANEGQNMKLDINDMSAEALNVIDNTVSMGSAGGGVNTVDADLDFKIEDYQLTATEGGATGAEANAESDAVNTDGYARDLENISAAAGIDNSGVTGDVPTFMSLDGSTEDVITIDNTNTDFDWSNVDQSGTPATINITKSGTNLSVDIAAETGDSANYSDLAVTDSFATQNADGDYVYDAHGVKFTISEADFDAMNDTDTIAIDMGAANSAGTTASEDLSSNIGTKDDWTTNEDASANLSDASFTGDKISFDAAKLEEGAQSINISGANLQTDGTAAYTVEVYDGADGTGNVLSSDVYTFDTAATAQTFSYENHGVSFELNQTDAVTLDMTHNIEQLDNSVQITGSDDLGLTVTDADGVDRSFTVDLDTGTYSLQEIADEINAAANDVSGANWDGNDVASVNGDSLTLNSPYAGGDSTITVSDDLQVNDVVGGTGNIDLFGGDGTEKTGSDASINFTLSEIDGDGSNDLNANNVNPSDGGVTFTDSSNNEVEFDLKSLDSLEDVEVSEYFAASNFDREVSGIDVTSQEAADNAISTIDDAIANVSSERSKLGAVQNRLEHTINNLNTAEENLTAAESRISDVDMAREMMNMSKQQILSQAGTAMMAQANQLPQGVLQLLG